MRCKLTERVIRQLEPTAKPFRVWDTEQPALFVRVQPSGRKAFIVSYRADGRLTNHTLGRYGAITLAQARGLARKALGTVASGSDPQQERKARRAEVERARREAERARKITLGAFIAETYKPWLIQHRKSGAATLARLQACFRHWWNKPMPGINPWLVERWRADRIKAGRKPATVNRDIVALKAALAKPSNGT